MYPEVDLWIVYGVAGIVFYIITNNSFTLLMFLITVIIDIRAMISWIKSSQELKKVDIFRLLLYVVCPLRYSLGRRPVWSLKKRQKVAFSLNPNSYATCCTVKSRRVWRRRLACKISISSIHLAALLLVIWRIIADRYFDVRHSCLAY